MNRPGAVDVLVVDDDADDRGLTLRALRGMSRPPSTAEVDDGEKAIEFLCRQDRYSDLAGTPWPRLVLLDLKLPFRNGIEVVQSVRREGHCPSTPIVLLTSSEHSRDMAAAYAAGANGYVVKPGTYAEYLPWIRRTAEYWLEINRTPSQTVAPGRFVSSQ